MACSGVGLACGLSFEVVEHGAALPYEGPARPSDILAVALETTALETFYVHVAGCCGARQTTTTRHGTANTACFQRVRPAPMHNGSGSGSGSGEAMRQ